MFGKGYGTEVDGRPGTDVAGPVPDVLPVPGGPDDPVSPVSEVEFGRGYGAEGCDVPWVLVVGRPVPELGMTLPVTGAEELGKTPVPKGSAVVVLVVFPKGYGAVEDVPVDNPVPEPAVIVEVTFVNG